MMEASSAHDTDHEARGATDRSANTFQDVLQRTTARLDARLALMEDVISRYGRTPLPPTDAAQDPRCVQAQLRHGATAADARQVVDEPCGGGGDSDRDEVLREAVDALDEENVSLAHAIFLLEATLAAADVHQSSSSVSPVAPTAGAHVGTPSSGGDAATMRSPPPCGAASCAGALDDAGIDPLELRILTLQEVARQLRIAEAGTHHPTTTTADSCKIAPSNSQSYDAQRNSGSSNLGSAREDSLLFIDACTQLHADELLLYPGKLLSTPSGAARPASQDDAELLNAIATDHGCHTLIRSLLAGKPLLAGSTSEAATAARARQDDQAAQPTAVAGGGGNGAAPEPRGAGSGGSGQTFVKGPKVLVSHTQLDNPTQEVFFQSTNNYVSYLSPLGARSRRALSRHLATRSSERSLGDPPSQEQCSSSVPRPANTEGPLLSDDNDGNDSCCDDDAELREGRDGEEVTGLRAHLRHNRCSLAIHALDEPLLLHKVIALSHCRRISLGHHPSLGWDASSGSFPQLGDPPPVASDVYSSPAAAFAYRTLTFEFGSVHREMISIIVPLENEFLRLVSQLSCFVAFRSLRGPECIFSHFRPRQVVIGERAALCNEQLGEWHRLVCPQQFFCPIIAAAAFAPLSQPWIGYEYGAELPPKRFPALRRMQPADADFCAVHHISPEIFLHVRQSLLDDPLREWFGLLDVASLLPRLCGLNLWEAKAILSHFVSSMQCEPVELIFVPKPLEL